MKNDAVRLPRLGMGTWCFGGRTEHDPGNDDAGQIEALRKGIEAGFRLIDTAEYYASKVVVATGGRSYPVTGSTGMGYKLAESVGHTVTEIRPSLVPVVCAGKDCAEMMGLSLRNCTLSLYDGAGTKPVFTELGELLFTHFGVSGPLVLSASAHMDGLKEPRLVIDFKPGLTEEKLDDRLLRDIAEQPNKDISNLFRKLLPAKAIPVVLKRCGLEGFRKGNGLTAEERARVVAVLKGFELTVKGLRPVEEAIITRGGVSVDEISPKNMESKLVSGLYFIGEVLDVDAYTGGFNLQIAFSTAYACANG